MATPVAIEQQMQAKKGAVPLCVDLNLIKAHVLQEAFIQLLKVNMVYAVLALGWLLKGTENLKKNISARVPLNVELLPWNEEFCSWLREERANGRSLILCSFVDRRIAEEVAQHCGLFEKIIVDPQQRSARERLADTLARDYGEKGFDYAGGDTNDLTVWRRSRCAIVVSPSHKLQRELALVPRLTRVFGSPRGRMRAWLNALRIHQWAKNLLIFVPALAAHRLLEPHVFTASLVAFTSFGFCASGTYVLNDLWDLDADRSHPRKRRRPFAAGDLPLLHGIVLGPVMIASAFALAASVLGVLFGAVLAIYIALSTWYSARLKRIAMVDVLSLCGLYTIRIFAGSVATAIPPSFWLLALSTFLFFSLAVAKRYTELCLMHELGRANTAGRGYATGDLPFLLAMGTGAGMLSVLVLALYINSAAAATLYSREYLLWLVCPVFLYWICRVWLKTHRHQLNDDPLVFALTDRPSLLAGALCAVLALLAL